MELYVNSSHISLADTINQSNCPVEYFLSSPLTSVTQTDATRRFFLIALEKSEKNSKHLKKLGVLLISFIYETIQ